jgi:hypothetical protein
VRNRLSASVVSKETHNFPPAGQPKQDSKKKTTGKTAAARCVRADRGEG